MTTHCFRLCANAPAEAAPTHMSLTIPQQIQQLIEHKKHILLTFRADGGGDAIASACALFLFLQKMNARADMVVDHFTLPRQYQFLKGADSIRPEFASLQKFIMTVDVAKAGVQELSYDVKEQTLRIFITPKTGFLTRDHVRTAQSDFKYDLIITVGTRDLESLGALYDNNTDLFYKTPIVNIDHHPANEHFGQINCIDLTATSTAEVVYDLFKKLGEQYIDADIATALLTGMIAHTHSFKTENVKPFTLATAGKLVSLGADRDYIIKNLYRTRTISTLKLWGHALSHMQEDKTTGLVWTAITREDFTRSGAAEQDLNDIIDELISTAPEAKSIVLFHEHTDPARQNSIHVIMRATEKHVNAMELLRPFNPKGNADDATCVVEGRNLKQAEDEVVGYMRTVLRPNGLTV